MARGWQKAMAEKRIVAVFTLKPGVAAEEYEAWARTVDLPTVNRLPSIKRFEVFKAQGLLGSDAAAPFQYIETIDVTDMDQFGADVATATMQAVAGHFQSIADVTFIMTEKLAWDGDDA